MNNIMTSIMSNIAKETKRKKNIEKILAIPQQITPLTKIVRNASISSRQNYNFAGANFTSYESKVNKHLLNACTCRSFTQMYNGKLKFNFTCQTRMCIYCQKLLGVQKSLLIGPVAMRIHEARKANNNVAGLHFVTLTAPTVFAWELEAWMAKMPKEWSSIYNVVSNAQRRRKKKFNAIRKLECTVDRLTSDKLARRSKKAERNNNPREVLRLKDALKRLNRAKIRLSEGIKERNDMEYLRAMRDSHSYHVHYHLLVQGRGVARSIKDGWLKRFPLASNQAQDIRPFDGRVAEMVKYTAKMTCDSGIAGQATNAGFGLFYHFAIKRKLRTWFRYGDFRGKPTEEELAKYNEQYNEVTDESEGGELTEEEKEGAVGYDLSKSHPHLKDGVYHFKPKKFNYVNKSGEVLASSDEWNPDKPHQWMCRTELEKAFESGEEATIKRAQSRYERRINAWAKTYKRIKRDLHSDEYKEAEVAIAEQLKLEAEREKTKNIFKGRKQLKKTS